MTHQTTQHLDHDCAGMTLCRQRIDFRRLLAMTLFVVGTGYRCSAQSVIYQDSYPVHSYQGNSYPVGQPVVVNNTTPFPESKRFVDLGPSYRSSASLRQPSQNPAVRVTTKPTAKGADSDKPKRQKTTSMAMTDGSKENRKHNTLTRLASTKNFRSRSQYASGRTFDSRRPHVDTISRYDLGMIHSARQSAFQFRRIAQNSQGVTAKMALENADFAEQWADLAETHLALSDRLSTATTKLDTTIRDFEDVTAKLDNHGLTPTIGMLLRNKKEQLDRWQVHDSGTLLTSEELGRSRQEQLELEMVRYDGTDRIRQTAEILAVEGLDRESVQGSTAASQIQGLLHSRRQWLDSLQQGYQDYQQKLGELDAATTASATLATDYRKLIDRQITWIRSGDPVSTGDLRKLDNGLAAFFDSRRSGDFGLSLQRKWQASPASGIGMLACTILILVVRWRSKSWLVGIGNRKRMREASADSRKVAASFLTCLIALAFPSMLYVIARWLGAGVVSEATLHASSGLYAASLIALMIETPRQLLRSFGYVDKHVDVELPRRERATAYLTLIGFGLVLAAYVITLTGLMDHGIWRGSVSRFGFMAAMLLVAWTFHLSLRPTGGFLEPLIAKFGGSVIHRIRLVIYLAGIGFPLAMLVLSALGYGFTANVLIKRAIITLVSLLIGATLWAGIKILSAHAWQMLTGSTPPPRQFDEYGEIKTADSGAQVTGVLAEHSLELKHQLAFLCQCALVLGAIFSFGWLWIDIIPNVQMGNPVVWTVQDTVTQSTVDATGQTVTSSVVVATPITAMHLLLAAATMFVAFQLAKLLPALFDALVLQRVSFDEGMEHFSLVLGRCLLFGIGCFIACKWVGVRWQAIQWLAVGLMIGLGFGLQDMVRNLFGGLIVLFEKPARLGDLITVGKVKGRVAAQKLRTTVLSDDDGREVIIPNKNFVSEEIVNWMGAGRLNVIPIEVAVSRAERPADICRILQEFVLEQEDVLLTPAPQATLVCVAKSSQRIEVRVWIEQGQDANRYREKLRKVVTTYLRENDLLTANQPTQPELPSTSRVDSDSSYRSTARKRRAA